MIAKITKILGFIGVIFLLINGYLRLIENPGFFFITTNLLIILISTSQIYYSRNNFSSRNIVFIFVLFFFGLSPLYQVNTHFRTWGYFLTPSEILITNSAIIFCLILFSFFSRPILANKHKSEECNISNVAKSSSEKLFDFIKVCNLKLSIKIQIMLLLLSSLLFVVFFWYYEYNILGILFRGGIYEPNFRGSMTEYLVISYFVRPLIFNIFLFTSFHKGLNNIVLILLFILAIVAVFPTGVPRFFAAVIYLTYLTIFIFKNLRINISLLFVLSFSLIFIFPFLDIFRWFKDSNLTNYEVSIDLYSGNFDAFGMFALALSKGVVVYGANILTAILFFVPRTIWPTKEVGSGHKISGELDLTLDNVSMPFFAEGYLALGILGLILFPLILARVVYLADKYFYNNTLNEENISILSPLKIIFFFNFIFLCFFILRGDLLSSYAYLFGISSSNLILYLYTKFVSRLKV